MYDHVIFFCYLQLHHKDRYRTVQCTLAECKHSCTRHPTFKFYVSHIHMVFGRLLKDSNKLGSKISLIYKTCHAPLDYVDDSLGRSVNHILESKIEQLQKNNIGKSK